LIRLFVYGSNTFRRKYSSDARAFPRRGFRGGISRSGDFKSEGDVPQAVPQGNVFCNSLLLRFAHFLPNWTHPALVMYQFEFEDS
jgi:hypothetical protein